MSKSRNANILAERLTDRTVFIFGETTLKDKHKKRGRSLIEGREVRHQMK